MPSNGIDEGAVEITAPRMHNHAGRLVDHHQLVILIDNLQRDILRFDGGVIMRAVEHQSNHIARAYLIITLYRISIHMNETRIGGFLDSVTARMRLMFCQKLVDAYGNLTFIYLDTEVLIQIKFEFDVVHNLTHCPVTSFISSKSSVS